jgi:hypothetical protein
VEESEELEGGFKSVRFLFFRHLSTAENSDCQPLRQNSYEPDKKILVVAQDIVHDPFFSHFFGCDPTFQLGLVM